MFLPLRGHPPFSLRDCFNLSELTLDMERTSSCIVSTIASILSTLGPTQRCRLERIKLTTSCVYRWVCKESRRELAQAWGDLDTILSELAKVAITMWGKRLTFTLMSAGIREGECVSFGRKWLPELLPHFHELGLLHIDRGSTFLRLAADCNNACSHPPICMDEDYNHPSSG